MLKKAQDPLSIFPELISRRSLGYRLGIFIVLGIFVVFIPPSGSQYRYVIKNHLASSKLNHRTVELTPASSQTDKVFLPLIHNRFALPLTHTYRVNVPFFDDEIRFGETGIFWFGKVNSSENYVDVRLGFTSTELYVRLAVFDRRLWYDTSPTLAELTHWDAASLYLDLDGNTGSRPDLNSYQFIGQLNWSEPREGYQAAYRGDGSGWLASPVSFTTISRYRGDAPNSNEDDRGWTLTYRIPFTSLELDQQEPEGKIWGLAVTLYDRDDAAGTSMQAESWPPAMLPGEPDTWGQLVFGLPLYTIPSTTPSGNTIIRKGLNEAKVVDGMVGGSSTCGTGLDFWTEWGEANYSGASQVNIQNQFDVADWPCFSKVFITFPLDAIPPAAEVISATLTFFQFGNAGGGQYGDPFPSLIQIFTVVDDWEETILNWNNAPLAWENVSRAWVDPVTGPMGYPGIPRTWDVSRVVAEAHRADAPLRLALYSADGDYNSGKYFYSSDMGDWNAEGRPTLTVVWGYP
jgi:hypothetical protein